MPTHDCTTCKIAGQCPLEDIAPWLNEHEEEVDTAIQDQRTALSKACTKLTMALPLAFLYTEELVAVTTSAFAIGYCKGRRFPIVPEVFKYG